MDNFFSGKICFLNYSLAREKVKGGEPVAQWSLLYAWLPVPWSVFENPANSFQQTASLPSPLLSGLCDSTGLGNSAAKGPLCSGFPCFCCTRVSKRPRKLCFSASPASREQDWESLPSLQAASLQKTSESPAQQELKAGSSVNFHHRVPAKSHKSVRGGLPR